MKINSERFSEARRASGLSMQEAADACGIARQTYQSRERHAGDFRLYELSGLNEKLNVTGKRLLSEAVESVFFCPDSSD